MYTQTNLATIGNLVSSIDLGLNMFLQISWDILLPYTIVGIGLMAYSQIRLIIGQYYFSSQNQNK